MVRSIFIVIVISTLTLGRNIDHLFGNTCDDHSSKWGSKFEDVHVRDPCLVGLKSISLKLTLVKGTLCSEFFVFIFLLL